MTYRRLVGGSITAETYESADDRGHEGNSSTTRSSSERRGT